MGADLREAALNCGLIVTVPATELASVLHGQGYHRWGCVADREWVVAAEVMEILAMGHCCNIAA